MQDEHFGEVVNTDFPTTLLFGFAGLTLHPINKLLFEVRTNELFQIESFIFFRKRQAQVHKSLEGVSSVA